jgi:hypothetical protein
LLIKAAYAAKLHALKKESRYGDTEERRLFTLRRYEEQEEIDSWQPGTAS